MTATNVRNASVLHASQNGKNKTMSVLAAKRNFKLEDSIVQCKTFSITSISNALKKDALKKDPIKTF